MTIPNGYAQINWICEGAAVPTGAQFTLGVDISGYADDPVDLAEEAADIYDDLIAPYVCDGAGITGVLVKYGPDATGPSAFFDANVNGEAAGNPATPNTAYLVSKITNLGGRAGRGRMYIPGVVEAKVDGSGAVDATWRGLMNADMAALVIRVGANVGPPVVLHQPGSPLSVPTPITAMSVSTRVATQRQRLRR